MDAAWLNTIGKIWSQNDFPPDLVTDEANGQVVDTLARLLGAKPSRSVLLIGESGVGKSAIIQLLAHRLKKAGWFIFMASAGDVQAGQTYIGQIEEQVKALIDSLSSKQKTLWIIPDFHQLYYSGRHKYTTTGVLDLLLPDMESGRIRVIGEIRPDRFERILQFRPKLRNALELIRVQTPDSEYALKLARAWADKQRNQVLWGKLKAPVLKEAASLSRQYLGQRAEPGNLIDFLKSVGQHLEAEQQGDHALKTEDLIATLSNLTGLPEKILDDGEALDLKKLKRHFEQRVIGQEEAVGVLIERIALIKAGLTDPSRPSGVFLFVGPTGTGKTELAKALADYLFGSEERMIRLDMSEFQTADALLRLTGDGEEASENRALTDRIRISPFSVILLDEFEKAHRNIWDLFLQVFDDGRLTDQRGNTADFRNAIIIMTSNLGVGRPARTAIGYAPSPDSEDSGDDIDAAMHATFRPEFINRIDRVVRFHPLSRAVLRDILRKELQSVLQRRGFRRRQWAVEWEDSAIEFLLEKGYSPSLGARPMKRSIERYLLAPLALAIVQHQFPKGDQFLFVRRSGQRLKVDFVDPDEPNIEWTERREKEKAQRTRAETLTLRRVAFEAQGTLAEREVLSTVFGKLAGRLESEEWERRRQELFGEMGSPGFWEREDRFATLSEVEYRDRFEAGLETAHSLLERLADRGKTRLSFPADTVRRLAERLHIMEASLEAFAQQRPQDAYLRISSGKDPAEAAFAARLDAMYRSWMRKRKMNHRELEMHNDAGGFRSIYAVAGFGAWPLLEGESGIHVFEKPDEAPSGRRSEVQRIRVHIAVAPQPEQPVADAAMQGLAAEALDAVSAGAARIVRRYRELPSPLVRDAIAGWRSGRLDRVLGGDFDLME